MSDMRKMCRSLALAAVALMTLNGCGGGGGTEDTPTTPTTEVTAASTGVIAGRVGDAKTRAALSGVSVQIGTQNTTTDANGNYELTSVPTGTGIVARFSKDQFATNYAILDVVEGQTTFGDLRLAQVAVKQEVDAAAGDLVVLADSPAVVQLPAAGLVNKKTGAPVIGKVFVEMTPIDPGINVSAMPGNYRAGNETAPIESMGALQVEIRDQNGELLDLAAGKTATIHIPVPSGAQNPDLTIPLYHFNESTGLWQREGNANLGGTAPDQFYEAQVSHFTVWHAAKPAQTIVISGCVRDSLNKPVVATVQSSGVNYFSAESVQTDANGNFRIPARRDSEVKIYARVGDVENSVVVVTGMDDLTMTECLNTAKNPPAIVTEPSDMTFDGDGGVWLKVVAINALKIQWYRNDLPIGDSSAYLLIRGGDSAAGEYHAVVTNDYGFVKSRSAIISWSAFLEANPAGNLP
ncbi:MAG: carboxypeptidase regulatory-like domain-containing protein [Pseudomonadota bacterium]